MVVAAPRPGASTWTESYRQGLQEVVDEAMATRPDTVPFTFPNYPHHVTYLHPPCGTVESVDPAYAGVQGSMTQAIAEGLCDCENASPWVKVYVEAQR
jgi:hypothetical protein